MADVFFIADTHFGHEAIMRYESRPFASVEAMDEAIIANWNSVVTPGDSVWMLGDFSLYPKDATIAVLAALNGEKRLVMGNHDRRRQPGFYRDAGFCEVYDLPVVYPGNFLLSHEPLYVNRNMPYANIYGHVHGCATYADYCGQSFCVSCERVGYTPVSIEYIKQKMSEAQ